MPRFFSSTGRNRSTRDILMDNPIPLGKRFREEDLMEILTPDTTVFSVFVPLTLTREEDCPVFRAFLPDLVRQAAIFGKLGMRYVLATDRNAMSETQYARLQVMFESMGVEVWDISRMPEYIPYNKAFNRSEHDSDAVSLYQGRVVFKGGEYVDSVKLWLANLAGREAYRNVLVMDFDIRLEQPSLKILREDKIAFTYSWRHSTPATRFNTENSMIFVSAQRPLYPGREKDMIETILSDIHEAIEVPHQGSSLYGAGNAVYPMLCADIFAAMNIEQAKKNLREKLFFSKRMEYIKLLYKFEQELRKAGSNPGELDEGYDSNAEGSDTEGLEASHDFKVYAAEWINNYEKWLESKISSGERTPEIAEIEEIYGEIFEDLYQYGENLCSDDIGQQLLHAPEDPEGTAEQVRIAVVQLATQQGNFLIHGDYYSINKETWRSPGSGSSSQPRFAAFEEAEAIIQAETAALCAIKGLAHF